jgi:hypothetical protein
MPATTTTQAAPATLGRARVEPRAAAAFGLALLLPAYLAFAGGGYDDVLRDEVGVAVWWIVLLGALVGVLPAGRFDRRTWAGLAALGAFVAWSGLAVTWSQSSERSVNELARLSMYAGVLILALATITPAGRRAALAGLVSGIGLVAVLALLSRLHPAWFPANVTAAYLPAARSRLAYPLNYWNGLAALLALGVPATLALADSARRLPGRALAAGSLPATAGALLLTGSRGGAIALAAGLLAYLALAPRRLPALATLVNAGLGAAVVVASIAQRPELDHGLTTALARRQGTQLIVIALLACAGVALAQAGIGLAARHAAPGRPPAVSRRHALQMTGLVLAAGVALFVALHGPAAVDRQWQAFKNPQLALSAAGQDSFQRFSAVSGNGRYQFWQASLDAAATHPWRGIGPGTFEFWWAAHGPFYTYLRNAHSLFFETLAEVGAVGLALLVVALTVILGRGLARATRADPERRLVLAAAVGGCVSFCVSAAVDWVWQLPAVVAAFLVLAAIALGPAGARRAAGAPARGQRLVLAGIAVPALVAIGIPLLGASDLRQSQAQAAAGRLAPALARAGAAASVEPFAAGPPLQRALVLELEGRLPTAAAAAAAATAAAPTDWRNWLVRSRIEAERGAPAAALAAYRRARALDPRSPVLAG